MDKKRENNDISFDDLSNSINKSNSDVSLNNMINSIDNNDTSYEDIKTEFTDEDKTNLLDAIDEALADDEDSEIDNGISFNTIASDSINNQEIDTSSNDAQSKVDVNTSVKDNSQVVLNNNISVNDIKEDKIIDTPVTNNIPVGGVNNNINQNVVEPTLNNTSIDTGLNVDKIYNNVQEIKPEVSNNVLPPVTNNIPVGGVNNNINQNVVEPTLNNTSIDTGLNVDKIYNNVQDIKPEVSNNVVPPVTNNIPVGGVNNNINQNVVEPTLNNTSIDTGLNVDRGYNNVLENKVEVGTNSNISANIGNDANQELANNNVGNIPNNNNNNNSFMDGNNISYNNVNNEPTVVMPSKVVLEGNDTFNNSVIAKAIYYDVDTNCFIDANGNQYHNDKVMDNFDYNDINNGNNNQVDDSYANSYKVKIVKQKPSLLHLIVNVISYTLFILLLILGLVLLFYVVDNKIREAKGDTTPAKYNAYVVLTGSMEPNIHINDVVITKYADPKDLKKNDIVTFWSDYYNVNVTHRIMEVYYDDTTKEYMFKTKGDNNNSYDASLLKGSDIYGQVILKIPKLGYIQNFLANQGGWIIVILIPCLAIISYDIMKLFKMAGNKAKILK